MQYATYELRQHMFPASKHVVSKTLATAAEGHMSGVVVAAYDPPATLIHAPDTARARPRSLLFLCHLRATHYIRITDAHSSLPIVITDHHNMQCLPTSEDARIATTLDEVPTVEDDSDSHRPPAVLHSILT
jgi:hypothetical protein